MTALLVPVLASGSGILEVRAAFASFAHPLIFLFLAGFGLAAALLRYGLDRQLAAVVLRMAGGGFLASSFALFSIGAFLSMWISNTAAVALLLPVALGILGRVESEAGAASARQVTPFVLLGVAYSASIGGIGTVIGSPPNAIAAATLGYSFLDWMKVGIPMVLVLLPCLFALLWMSLNPRRIRLLSWRPSEAFSWSLSHTLVLFVFALALTGWLAGPFLADSLGIDAHVDSLVAVAALVLLATLRLIDWKDLDATADWGVLVLFGGGLSLSVVLGESGVSRFLAAQLAALSQDLAPIWMVGCLVTFVVFLTELTSNTATAALFVPIFFATAIDLDLPPESLVVPLTIACSCAFMLPIATPANAMVFASGRLAQQTMLRAGLVLNLAFALLVSLLSWCLL